MIININKNTTKEEIDKKLASIKPKKINLKKYVGVLKGEIDGLAYQKKIRSEWD